MKTKIFKSILSAIAVAKADWLLLTVFTVFAVLFYTCKKDEPEPVADFTTNTTSITEGGTVNFTDLSTNTPTSWSWDFGDSATSTSQNPSHTYSTAGTYTVSLTATNAYGSDNEIKNDYITVTSGLETGTLYDSRDGQTYNTVKIGNQWWMAENLNIGTRIDGINDQTNNAIIEKYCYNDLTSNCALYGGLYQWDEMIQFAPSDTGTIGTTQGVCPTGWHIPTHHEWTTLERAVCTSGTCDTDFPYDYTTMGWLGTDEGGKLKESGTSHWLSPNEGATNSSGFTALPGGYRTSDGSFSVLGYYAFFWSATESDASNAWRRRLYYDNAGVTRYSINKSIGFCVRCVQD